MGKRKKHSTEMQRSAYTQNVAKLQEKTSPAHVPASSEEATRKTNTQTTKNVRGRAPLEFMSSMAQVKFPNLTPTTMLQIKNDPLHMESTEPYDPIHRNEKCLSTATVMEQYPKEENADQRHNNAHDVSAEIEENTIVIQTKIFPSVTSMTGITHTTNTLAEAESAVKTLQHLVVQQNVTVTSIQKETQRNLDSESTPKNGLLPANVSPAESTETPGFLQSLYSTTHSHSALSKENTTKIENELCERNNLISGVQDNPLILLVTKQPSTTNTQNLANTTGPANELSNKQNITGKVKITEKLSGTKVPQLCATHNTALLNTHNKQSIREVNEESNISKHITSNSTLPVQENESFAETTAEDTSKSTDKENTNRATAKKQSILQINGSEISAINQMSASSVLSTATVQTKSDLFQNVGINFDLTASTMGAGISTNISQCSPTSSGCSVQKSTNSLSQEAKVAKLGKEVPAFSSRAKTVLGGLSTEYSDISAMSQTTQKSKRTPSHVNKTKVGKDVPVLPLTTKAVQGGTSTEDTSVTCNTSQPTYARSRCLTQNSKSSISLAVRVKKLSEEVPVHLSTVQVCANTKDDVRTTTIPQSTQKLSTASHGANVSELGEEVSILPPTDNVERQKVPVASNKAEKEALSVVRDNNTTEMIQVCVQAANREVLNKTTKAKRAKQHTLMDKSVSKISLSPLSESPESTNQHIIQESKGLNALMTQTEVKKKGTTNTKVHSFNKNVKYHKGEENRQNSFTDLLVNAINEKVINDYALEKIKKHKRNKEKKMAQEGNRTDIQRKQYVEPKTCDHEDEKIQSQMDPDRVQGKEKKNEDSKPGDSSKTKLKKEGPKENKLSNSTQTNKKASATISKGQLAHLTTTVHLCPSPEDSERTKTIFIPDTLHSQSAPKPVSTVDEAELEYQLVQRHIFLSYVCHVCKSLESSKCSLKKCSNCKMISYCSKEHQRQHWSAHKDLCKVISKICKHNRMTNLFEKALGISSDQYRYYRNHYVNECTKELGRELYLWEKEMIYYPQVCHTCYESDRQKLTTCQKCHHVSYCQLSHLKTDHDIWCKEFQVYRDIILYQCYNGIIQPSIPDMVLQQYTPLTGDMKTFMLNNNTVSGKLSSLNRLNFVALTDIATCPLTVLFSLQHCNFCLEEIRSLTIHLVGAEMQFEIDTLSKWELLLLHLVPSLRTLKVVFVGPQLETESAYIQTIGKKTCKECNAAGRKVIYEFWKTLYHDYLKCDEYHKPDLISAFNAGLYRLSDFEGKDTWSPSIEAMLKETDIPVVVTEYTDKELPFDIQRIQNIVDSLEIIMPPARNPFASLKPSLNFLSDEAIPVIFKNFHITILKRKNIKMTTI
ncbi:hypothetical protein B7P43_G02627 [Cryptotermes secundus]|uniref:MYND-type domain-containing protein n=1 Tax=Cryptotermes secundus TaxID=105785 RepID=A0A2J7PP89_9NEOP|nr:hypothetical protein B7P43_G02627 [Cryptotermes secundus]